jgi:hypothetical protein
MSSNLSGIGVSQLKRAIRIKQKIESLTAKLDDLLGSSGSSDSGPRKGKKRGPKGKRKMSAAGRARISAAAKRRWKAAKAAGKSRL